MKGKLASKKAFLDIEAEEASDIEDEEDEDLDENERAVRQGQVESQYYTKDQLHPRKGGINENLLSNMEMRYKQAEEMGEDVEDDGLQSQEYEDEEEMLQQARLPTSSDPSLWQVRVKRGQEKQATLQLMNKAICKAKSGQHLSILSVTCTDKVEGFIYVEAFKEIHVKEAITGLSVILGGKCLLVQKEEMPGIYQND